MRDIYKYERLSRDEIYALRALEAGEASAYHQKLALYVITNKLCRPHDVAFKEGSSDGTAFLAGRAFVGQMILRYLKIPIAQLEKLLNE